MRRKKKIFLTGTVLTALMSLLWVVQVFGADGEEAAYEPAVYATFWSLVPPIVAIVLALITKEVYSSLL